MPETIAVILNEYDKGWRTRSFRGTKKFQLHLDPAGLNIELISSRIRGRHRLVLPNAWERPAHYQEVLKKFYQRNPDQQFNIKVIVTWREEHLEIEGNITNSEGYFAGEFKTKVYLPKHEVT